MRQGVKDKKKDGEFAVFFIINRAKKELMFAGFTEFHFRITF